MIDLSVAFRCNVCPTGGVCNQGTTIQAGIPPAVGFFPAIGNPLEFLQCQTVGACLGSAPGSTAPLCATGYSGNLCAHCQPGYGMRYLWCIELTSSVICRFIPCVSIPACLWLQDALAILDVASALLYR